MFLSFIIPVYNAEAYISACIDSLYNQDLGEEDYELICVDDASSDGSLSILQRLAQKHGNFHVFTQTHKGVSAARNLGMEHARGDYVWFVDADDFIAPNVLKTIRRMCLDESLDRLHFGAYAFNIALQPQELAQLRDASLKPNSGVYAVSAACSVFRRALLSEARLRFHEGVVTSEDALFLCELSAWHPKQAHLDRAVYFWRKNPGSATMGNRLNSNSQKLDSYLYVLRHFLAFYRGRKGDLRFCADYLMSNLWSYMYLSAGLEQTEYRSRLRQAAEVGVFPLRRPPECTLTSSYMTTRRDLWGKLFEYIYMHQHRRWGVRLMRLYRLLLRKRG